MARPRKRKRLSESEEDQKRLGIENESKESTYSGPEINHPVLSCFYHNILTLRQYLLSRLPETSKRRRRAITLFGFEDVDIQSCPRSADIPRKDILRLLDTTIVGFDNGIVPCRDDDYEHDLAVFSQQVPGSSLGSTLAPGDTLQSEIVDFVIWHFFKHNAKPSHILCRGFLRASGPSRNGLNLRAALGIPGVVSYFPNTHVETVKSPIWSTVLASLGRGGDRVMLDLLIHCTLFVSLEDRSGNYSQLSGIWHSR
ncbi:hypothetical protein M501DRAFT_28316 [Patellaria atrata CBS 101060]|uniref:Telomerase reverse transcriptase n=1 Tax=Patellaria atrata CBS 101060 TaxID=1346257 RepID=A0A9P4SI76_9PEZI|nr:hypothetical protein M501DRAFT_28316 [Patellaria atrata CBS 101060]